MKASWYCMCLKFEEHRTEREFNVRFFIDFLPMQYLRFDCLKSALLICVFPYRPLNESNKNVP